MALWFLILAVRVLLCMLFGWNREPQGLRERERERCSGMKATVTTALIFAGIVGWFLGASFTQPSPATPTEYSVVSDPSEMPSVTPSPTETLPAPQPAPTAKGTYVPPRTNSPDPTNPAAGGNTGGGYSGGQPAATGT